MARSRARSKIRGTGKKSSLRKARQVDITARLREWIYPKALPNRALEDDLREAIVEIERLRLL